MRDTRIILVEGMPGTGKSTVSQFIHLRLRANGRPSRWWHEESASHPVRLFYDPERHLSWSDYSDEVVSRWQSYAHELHGQEQIAVLDVAILQNHVRSMLIFNCDRSAILELAHRIEGQIASLDPYLIYLKPNDVETSFRDVVEARGQRMLELWIEAHDHYPYTRQAQVSGYPGFIAFWEEFGDISDRVFERLGIAKLRPNDSRGERDARYGEILDFLDLPRPSDSSSSTVLKRFTGDYVPLDNRASPGFSLQARDGCLVASVDRPTIDVAQGPIGCFREVRLIPIEENDFYVEAWPHEVQFTADGTGMIVDMWLSVSADGWAKSSKVYVRKSP